MKLLLSIIVLCFAMVGAKAQTIEMQIFGDAPAIVAGTSIKVTVDDALRSYPQVVTDAVNLKGKVVAIEIEREVTSRGFTEDMVTTTVLLGAQYTEADNTVHVVHNLPPKDRPLAHGFGRWWLAGLLCMLLSLVIAWCAPSLTSVVGLSTSISVSVVLSNIAYIAAIFALTAAILAAAPFVGGVLLVGILATIVVTVKALVETKDNELRARGLKSGGLLFVGFTLAALPVFLYL